jgi:hypothetical protein
VQRGSAELLCASIDAALHAPALGAQARRLRARPPPERLAAGARAHARTTPHS